MSALQARAFACNNLPIPHLNRLRAQVADPAVSVMTDFRDLKPITIAETTTIDEALEHMKHAGVRSAFATQDQCITGLVTAYDIVGEKPMQYMLSVASSRRDVLVREIMLRIEHWHVVDFGALERATVADVAQLFDRTHLTHITVFEPDENGGPSLRGLLSAARVSHLLTR